MDAVASRLVFFVVFACKTLKNILILKRLRASKDSNDTRQTVWQTDRQTDRQTCRWMEAFFSSVRQKIVLKISCVVRKYCHVNKKNETFVDDL